MIELNRNNAKIYLVGGAVRDSLLGRPVKDKDWVITGALPDDLLEQGFEQVGKDFPVFLHPQTKEEYALARTERKQGKGYHGFSFNTSREVTLHEDLTRRDLTINALAQDENGEIIDYFGGLQDLEDRILRHVSPAFGEDPVRVLRVARFAARYHHLGFTVAPETLILMRNMVRNDEVNALVAERVWQELETALGEQSPEVFIQTLHDCEALQILFPEIENLFGVPQVAQWHPEIDTGLHTLMVLQQAVKLSDDKEVRFAALTHDLGKGVTDEEILPHHYGHEEKSAELVLELAERLRTPKKYKDLAYLVAKYHTHVHKAFEMKASKVLKVLKNCDAFRQPKRFTQILVACEADARGRAGLEDRAYPQRQFYETVAELARGVQTAPIIEAGFSGKKIAEELYRRRLNAIKKAIQQEAIL